MASSLGLYGNEAVPHLYPTSLSLTQRWEPGIGGIQSYRAPFGAHHGGKDDLDISQISQPPDDGGGIASAEALPSLCQLRLTKTPELCRPDPDLGLTPEKRVPVARSNLKGNSADCKDKAGLKVRFDVESSSESELEKSPEKPLAEFVNPMHVIVEKHVSQDRDEVKDSVSPHCSPITKTKVYPYTLPSALKQSQVSNIETYLSDKRKVSKSNIEQKSTSKGVNSDFRDEACVESGITREQKERPQVADYNFPFTEDSGNVQENGILLSCALERPEYNSTLRLGNELKQLTDSKPDVAQALKKTLKQSDTLRAEINEKAASRVNTEKDVFQGLASLQIPIDDIISQVERSQNARVKHAASKSKKDKSKESGLAEPDLMEFFTPDLQPEFADFRVTGVIFPRETLSTASHDTAFDLYRHNLAWEEFD